MFHNTRYSEVNDTNTSWPLYQLDFKPKSEWNAKVFALPNGFEMEVNESHWKLLNLEMNQKPISVFYIYSTYSPLRWEEIRSSGELRFINHKPRPTR